MSAKLSYIIVAWPEKIEVYTREWKIRYATLQVAPSLVGTWCCRNQQCYENLMIGRNTATFTCIVLSRSLRDVVAIRIMRSRGVLSHGSEFCVAVAEEE